MKIKQCIAAFAVACSLAAAAGCGKTYTDRLAAIEKEACACQGTRCANDTFDKYLAVVEDYRKNRPLLRPEERERLDRSNYRIVRCLLDSNLDTRKYRQEMNRLQEKFDKKTQR